MLAIAFEMTYFNMKKWIANDLPKTEAVKDM